MYCSASLPNLEKFDMVSEKEPYSLGMFLEEKTDAALIEELTRAKVTASKFSDLYGPSMSENRFNRILFVKYKLLPHQLQ